MLEAAFRGLLRGYREGAGSPVELAVDAEAPFAGILRYGAPSSGGMSGAPVFHDDDLVGAHTGLAHSGGAAMAAALDPPAWSACMKAAYAAVRQEVMS